MSQTVRIEKQLRAWPEDRNKHWVRASRRYGREIVRAELESIDPLAYALDACECDLCDPPGLATPGDMDYVRAFPSSPVRSV